ncbi:protein-L-isoaspartate O-methyltransferase [Lichenicola cladoniae]|uniref:Protein-L-isoaspartate O-methyltransferase n=1 Tax=Lichenicola cladoniae TaxID=1484109 RepID=A0A6M8HNP2_9PROT|nr:protein-L-isoaspartate O-methyltransferase [Lichenicola cladoniae]NPD67424.1 protein-L-isoaspartate O-methyltransferase [Acetobacteraceae bacterium]QKE89915.1 protein-L-isoaspartate O-methyltransferase [Lichenicola cladoniae]
MSQSTLPIAPGRAAPTSDIDGMPDMEFARHRMVDTQIRPVKVSDPRILKIMRTLPRERFVPADRAPVAYTDQNISLGDGRVLTEPRVIARMVQSLVPRRGERALVVGAGTGYAACLLEALGIDVVALEQNQALAVLGHALVAELAPAVRYQVGPLSDGYAELGPYDLILIDGAVRAIPDGLAAQLAPGGRMCGVLALEGHVATAFLAEASPVVGVATLKARPQFDAATPLLPELAPAPAFSF